jgi:hypothetical protein
MKVRVEEIDAPRRFRIHGEDVSVVCGIAWLLVRARGGDAGSGPILRG